jgi:molybdenum cofactor guanylyltransferase
MTEFKNFFIIGSSGRNSGKTEFACRVIEKQSKTHHIVGVKVKLVCTDKSECDNLCQNCLAGTLPDPGFIISTENNTESGKDTSRMLAAGAQTVFFLQTEKDKLEEGLNKLLKLIPEHAMVVCESNALRSFIEPSLFILIKNNDDDHIKESFAHNHELSDLTIDFHQNSRNFDPNRINIHNFKWVIKHQATAIILAGGKSSRMNGIDKSMIEIDGIPMIEHIIRQLQPHFEQIIIGSNETEKFEFLQFPVVSDIEKNKGPLMGIYSCLKASDNVVNFITACDIPIMNISLIYKMLKLSSDNDIVIPVSENQHFEPLFAVYKKDVIPQVETLLNNDIFKIIKLIPLVKTKFLTHENLNWYHNLNSTSDFEVYKTILTNKKDNYL